MYVCMYIYIYIIKREREREIHITSIIIIMIEECWRDEAAARRGAAAGRAPLVVTFLGEHGPIEQYIIA